MTDLQLFFEIFNLSFEFFDLVLLQSFYFSLVLFFFLNLVKRFLSIFNILHSSLFRFSIWHFAYHSFKFELSFVKRTWRSLFHYWVLSFKLRHWSIHILLKTVTSISRDWKFWAWGHWSFFTFERGLLLHSLKFINFFKCFFHLLFFFFLKFSLFFNSC